MTLQALPTPHCRQPGPPQLTPVSEPFCTGSEHVGFWQTKSAQALLTQSDACVQADRSRHGSQSPPQSMSLSFWFLVASEHEAA